MAKKSNILNATYATSNLVTVRTSKTSDGGKKTEVEVKPSVKGAAAGAAAGAVVAGPVGAVVGGAIGAIFGPE